MSLRQIPIKRFFSQKPPTASTTITPAKSHNINANIPGLSSYVIKKKSEPLGPGASATGIYKVPEYFWYVMLHFRFKYYLTHQIIKIYLKLSLIVNLCHLIFQAMIVFLTMELRSNWLNIDWSNHLQLKEKISEEYVINHVIINVIN